MRIENLLSLIEGELKNRPSIQKIAHITSDIRKIGRGDLFLALHKDDIPKAISKGAYAILYEGLTPITDQEIAWIKVKNIQKAAKKLFRFFLIQKEPYLINLDSVTFDLAKIIIEDDSTLFVDNWIEGLERLSYQKYIFLPNTLSQELHLETIEPWLAPVEIYQKYLFEISFVFNGIFYERTPLAPLFLENLKKIFWIIERFNILFQFESLSFNHFKPHFIESDFTPAEFGKSSRAIITEPSFSLLAKERDYLIAQAPWAQTLFLSQKPLEGFQTFKNLNQLKDILYNSPFTFALVHTNNHDWSFLAQKSQPKTLF